MSLIVGLALGAASVIALVDKRDVFGIFAANGPTKLIWGVSSAVLLVLALYRAWEAARRTTTITTTDPHRAGAANPSSTANPVKPGESSPPARSTTRLEPAHALWRRQTEPPPRAAKPPGGSATADGPINVEGPSDAADPDRAGRRASGPPRSKHRLRIVQQWLERNERTRRAGLRRPSSLRLQA